MKRISFIILSVFFSVTVFAQSKKIDIPDTLSYNSAIDPVTDTIPDIDIFGDETPMELTLKYDITSFIKNKRKGKYFDAELTIHYNDYNVKKSIRLKARGNNRRDQCFFPPIFLNFKTDTIKSTELKGIKKIKLVTHCSTSKAYTTYLLKEYLVYKLYNIISDNSFRVKLLKIYYIDTGKKNRDYRKFGILLEPIDLLAKRLNAIEIEQLAVKGKDVFEYEADIVSLFEYMIGNTDWKFKGGHNLKFLKPLSSITQKVIPVPYDFDFSGFVDTYYSHPQVWTNIDNVREREYMGYCRNDTEEYNKIINLFLDKKSEILKTIDSFTYLSEKERKSLHSYIGNFYNSIENRDSFLYTLRNECRSLDF